VACSWTDPIKLNPSLTSHNLEYAAPCASTAVSNPSNIKFRWRPLIYSTHFLSLFHALSHYIRPLLLCSLLPLQLPHYSAFAAVLAPTIRQKLIIMKFYFTSKTPSVRFNLKWEGKQGWSCWLHSQLIILHRSRSEQTCICPITFLKLWRCEAWAVSLLSPTDGSLN
jgi:hypothetical protein